MNDVINREDAIDAVLGIEYTAKLNDGDTAVRTSAVNYVLRNLPSAQPEIKTDGDTISRQAAIDAICDNCDAVEASCPHYPCGRYVAVEKLPPAQPPHSGRRLYQAWYADGYMEGHRDAQQKHTKEEDA